MDEARRAAHRTAPAVEQQAPGDARVRVPATARALPELTRLLAGGSDVEVTLLFSLDRYRAVLQACRSGLAQAAGAGLDVGALRVVTTFPVERIDAGVDRRLAGFAPARTAGVRSRTGAAVVRLAHLVRDEALAGAPWRELLAAGARPPRLCATGGDGPLAPQAPRDEDLLAAQRVLDGLSRLGLSHEALAPALQAEALAHDGALAQDGAGVSAQRPGGWARVPRFPRLLPVPRSPRAPRARG